MICDSLLRSILFLVSLSWSVSKEILELASNCGGDKNGENAGRTQIQESRLPEKKKRREEEEEKEKEKNGKMEKGKVKSSSMRSEKWEKSNEPARL